MTGWTQAIPCREGVPGLLCTSCALHPHYELEYLAVVAALGGRINVWIIMHHASCRYNEAVKVWEAFAWRLER